MLAVLPPMGNLNGHTNGTHQSAEMESFSIISDDDFADFSSGDLLESIRFDDLFGDSTVVLPDMEMDPNLLAEFSLCSGDEFYSDINTSTTTASVEKTSGESGGQSFGMESVESGLVYGLDSASCVTSQNDKEIVSKGDPDPSNTTNDKSTSSSKKEAGSNRHFKAHRSSSTKPLGVSSKGISKEGLQGKRKVKVDWTPELHKRFVQAVEQLGVDKAVPSRILEIMGIDCLTRHNIASHLQKYRSHRKHLLAREAEATSWSQRRHAFGPVTAGAVTSKRERGSPWLVPSIGFPPLAPPPPQHLHGHGHNSRPFHVWGHPSLDQSLRSVWPKPLPLSPSSQPHPIWPSSRHWHNKQTISQSIRNGLCQGAPCYPPPLGTTTRFPVQPIQGYPSHAMYKHVEPNGGFGVPPGQLRPNPLIDFHPSKESIDAAIGDVLSKPWLPLPIGLKPPELDSVMGELQRNGVPNIPPSCA